MKLFSLNYGATTMTVGDDKVLVRVWRDEMHVDHVMVLLNGRDAGGFDGPFDQCEVWVSGWIVGRISTRLK